LLTSHFGGLSIQHTHYKMAFTQFQTGSLRTGLQLYISYTLHYTGTCFSLYEAR